MKNILLIEDNQEVIDSIIHFFESTYNFFVFKKYSLIDIDLSNIDMILLDINLKDNEYGLDYVPTIKSGRLKHIPILIISGNNNQDEIITALKYGVNDYICKPLELNYLSYKMSNFLDLIESSNQPRLPAKIIIHDICVDIPLKQFSIGQNKNINLTKKEFEIFILLLNNFEQPVTREVILAKINNGLITTKRIVDTHILNLRKKIPSPYKIEYINNSGYCFFKENSN